MKEIEKSINVYVADDGKEFLDKTECEKYEELYKNIKYFVVYHSPDLNETGCFMKASVVAVYSGRYGHHKDIVLNWCVKTKGYPILCESVQGYGWQDGFSVSDSQEYAKSLWDAFDKDTKTSSSQAWTFPRFDDKVFLSPIEVSGFPKPFDYVTEYGLKK